MTPHSHPSLSSRRKPGSTDTQVIDITRLAQRPCEAGKSRWNAGWIPAFAGMTLLLAGTACTVGPDYHKPPVAVPVVYKEGGWQAARPRDALDRGPWWRVFDDPVLDRLEARIDISNQNLKAAEAAFREAEAIVAQARAGFFPTAQLDATATRSRSSGSLGHGPGGPGTISNLFSPTLSANWLPDLWGKVWRTVEGDVASAQASAGDVASARLAAQGQLASDYLQLRVADQLKRLLDASVVAYSDSLRITQNQYTAGIAAESDVAQARTQLDSTRAQAIATGVMRAQFEHAIAVLTGQPPAALTIAAVASVPELPEVPTGLPSTLLERRPDIAAAERRTAAANADIGVAETAFFPTLTLSGDAGSAAEQIAKLVSAPSRVWSLGGDITEDLLDAGARHAQVEQARAALDAAVADYRQTVLTGFQQVEDELAALRILAQQASAQDSAVTAAREAERVILNQYKAGTVAYTSVVVAQTAALSNAETALNVRQSRLLAAVALIQALGGGWHATQLPSREHIERDTPLDFNPLPPADAWPKLR
jgi:NodT family efflux transporter outer membrane factor (OMF) lipoprotein